MSDPILRAENYTVERINARYLQSVLPKDITGINIVTSFPRGEFRPPIIVVSQPTATCKWESLGGYGGGVPASTIPPAIGPRTVGEEGVLTHSDITELTGLRVDGTVVITVFAEVPDTRDKLVTWVLGAYCEQQHTGWFFNPANVNVDYDPVTGKHNLIRYAGHDIVAFSKTEITYDYDPKYVYVGDVSIVFHYHLDTEFIRAVVSGVDMEYDWVV